MKKLLIYLLLLFVCKVYAQNGSPTCDAAEPACSDSSGVKIFPNVTGKPSQGTFAVLPIRLMVLGFT